METVRKIDLSFTLMHQTKNTFGLEPFRIDRCEYNSICVCRYKLKWYKMPIVSQKLLIMIMIRSKRPLTITAEKFIVLSYVSFNAVSLQEKKFFISLFLFFNNIKFYLR